jgi:hypothetical protein
MPETPPNTVIVNLNVNVDAEGNINIFSIDSDEPTQNILDASAPLPITALYNDENNALIEFQGRGDDMVARYCADFSTDEDALTTNLSDLLSGGLKGGNADGSNGDAAPFNDPMYAGVAAYQNYSTFGKLALAAYAHNIFGHVQATAAIDNDTTIVDYLDGNDDDLDAPSGNAANIARNLADSILTGLSTHNLLQIVKQVIGQDASRATLQDNDNNDPVDGWQRLSFIDNDVVYVSITLQGPIVTYGGSASTGPQQFAAPTVEDIQYNVRMTMSSGDTPTPPPPGGVLTLSSAVLVPASFMTNTSASASVAGTLVMYASNGTTVKSTNVLAIGGSHNFDIAGGEALYTWTPSGGSSGPNRVLQLVNNSLHSGNQELSDTSISIAGAGVFNGMGHTAIGQLNGGNYTTLQFDLPGGMRFGGSNFGGAGLIDIGISNSDSSFLSDPTSFFFRINLGSGVLNAFNNTTSLGAVFINDPASYSITYNGSSVTFMNVTTNTMIGTASTAGIVDGNGVPPLGWVVAKATNANFTSVPETPLVITGLSYA